MAQTNPDSGTERRIDLGAPPADARADAMALVRLLLDRGQAIDSIGMIRWDALPGFLGERWDRVAPSLEQALRQHIEGRMGPESTCVRADDFGYLVVCGDRAWDAVAPQLLAGLSESVLGAIPPEGLIEAWRAAAFADGVLTLRRDAADTPPATAPAAEPLPDTPLVLADAEFLYWPIWAIRRNSVFCYACEPVWHDRDGRPLHEETVARRLARPRARAALDLEVLDRAAEKVEEILDHDLMASVLVPVHHSTLTDPKLADRYQAALRRPGAMIRSRLMVEVLAAGDGAAAAPAVAALRGWCPTVFVRVDPAFDAFPPLKQAGALSVGLDLRDDERPEAAIVADLEAFAEQTGRHDLQCYVLGLRSTSLSVAAVCAGFDFVGSDAIGEALAGWGMDDHLVKPIDLYRNLLRKASGGGGG